MRNGYSLLAKAVIFQAVKDWMNAVEQLGKVPDSKIVLAVKAECEDFFRSNWYQILCDVADGEVPLDMMHYMEEKK